MIYRIPVQLEDSSGTEKEVWNIDAEGNSPTEAGDIAGCIAARRIGTRIATNLYDTFRVAKVKVRWDLFKEPR